MKNAEKIKHDLFLVKVELILTRQFSKGIISFKRLSYLFEKINEMKLL